MYETTKVKIYRLLLLISVPQKKEPIQINESALFVSV